MSALPLKWYQDTPELEQFLLHNVRKTGSKPLGAGSFGVVEELLVGGTRCAGKKLHDVLLESPDGVDELIGRFVSECRLLSELRDPHIVQFIGLCFFKGSRNPVLVMERMDCSLDDLLEKNPDIPLSQKISILLDVATGLVFLHGREPAIIHRDLTARNILLTRGLSAKIGDLGNARLINPEELQNTMSKYPGTLLYMPPEAISSRPNYNAKIDIFSFGHLSLCTILQKFPKSLLSPTYTDLKTEKVLARTEFERREDYVADFEKIHGKAHPLLKLIKNCLEDIPRRRPTAIVVMEQLDGLLQRQGDSFNDLTKLDMLHLLNKEGEAAEINAETAYGSLLLRRIKEVQDGKPGLLEIYKSGGTVRKTYAWKRKTFKLTSTHLQYLQGQRDKMKDQVELSTVTSVKVMPDQEKFMFEVTFTGKGSPWVLSAYSKEDRTVWMEAIKPHIHAQLQTSSDEEDDVQEGYVDMTEVDMTVAANRKSTEVKQTDDILEEGIYEDIDVAIPKTEPVAKIAKSPKPAPPTRKLVVQNVAIPGGEHRAGVYFDQNQLDMLIAMLKNVHDTTAPTVTELCSSQLSPFNAPPPVGERAPPPTSPPPPPPDDIIEYYPDLDVLDETLDALHRSDDHYDDDDDAFERQRAASEPKPPIPPKRNVPPIPPKRTPPPIKPRKPKVPPKKSGGSTAMHAVPKSYTLPAQTKLVAPKPPTRVLKAQKQSTQDLKRLIMSSAEFSSTKMLITDDDDENVYEMRPTWAKASSVKSQPQSIQLNDLMTMQEAMFIRHSDLQHWEQIGTGQFGIIYKAKLRGDVTVAVKTIKKYNSKKHTDDFHREMTVMSRMVHPNIVKPYGIVQDRAEAPCIVLEYLPHGDLKTFLTKNKGERSVDQLMKYMMDVAMGMHYLSELGLVHRDLAARNIMVGINEICKVGDFGLLREVPKGKIYMATGKNALPIRWMPPESIEYKEFSTASDVWSYGVLQWEMYFPEKIPYSELDDMQYIASINRQDYHLSVPRPYPSTVARIMKACWNKNPVKRPSFLLITTLLGSTLKFE